MDVCIGYRHDFLVYGVETMSTFFQESIFPGTDPYKDRGRLSPSIFLDTQSEGNANNGVTTDYLKSIC